MNNYCINLKKRKGKPFCCKRQNSINLSECNGCINKEYKSIERKNPKIRSINKNAQNSKKIVHKSMKKRRNAQLNVKKSTYNYVINRDKYSCRLCGSTTTLQLHHIHGRGKDKTNNINNCIMLCSHCHLNIVHKNQKYWRHILDDIIKKGTDI